MKIYAKHKDGTKAIWFDPDDQTLNDSNGGVYVSCEAEADELAKAQLQAWEGGECN
jgi:hypothetical protein